jgi:nitrogen fixation/metabolism regulation signal transduction histidine kinase
VGAVGLGLWLARRLANPVLKLTESAKTIAAGRYDALVAVTTYDEIGALAEAFNLMAGTLCKRRSPNAPKLKSRCAVPTRNWSSA